MKYPYYDPELNRKYDCENEYDFKIKSFIEKNPFKVQKLFLIFVHEISLLRP